MKVFMIGPTGLLGHRGAIELINRGHTVSSIALPPLPDGLQVPAGLELKLGNYLEMTDQQLLTAMQGCQGFVFAAGIDERVEGPPPIYNLYKKYNIDALQRLMNLAAQAGIKHTVVLGSYFSHFANIWPQMELEKHHPYIRARLEQETMALSYANSGMDVAILELPYIFGAQPGRKPVWLFIAEMIKNAKGKRLFYPKGGTTMVTVRQVGECIAGALERNQGANTYPVGWFNITWKTWLEQFSADMGMPKKVVSIPTFLYKFAARKVMKDMQRRGIESGLEMVSFADLMTAETYIDKSIIQQQLGVTADDIDAAIQQSVNVCMTIINNPQKHAIDMKAE